MGLRGFWQLRLDFSLSTVSSHKQLFVEAGGEVTGRQRSLGFSADCEFWGAQVMIGQENDLSEP